MEAQIASLLVAQKELEERITQRDRTIEEQDDTIKDLRIRLEKAHAACTSFFPDYDPEADIDKDELEESDDDSNIFGEAVTASDIEDYEGRLALWDPVDHIFRCSMCQYEVDEGVCQWRQCGRKHQCAIKGRLPRMHSYDNFSTGDGLVLSDRQLAPRGDTPVLEDDAKNYTPLSGYNSAEYTALIGRGATPLMIERFNLEFTNDQGIVAWADRALFEDFAGQAALPGDRWKIHLGREVTLESDDADGSLFLEVLVDEAIRAPHSWETSLSRGTWITRPKADYTGEDSDSEDELEDEDEGPSTHGQAESEAVTQVDGESRPPGRAEARLEADAHLESNSEAELFPYEDEYDIDELDSDESEEELDDELTDGDDSYPSGGSSDEEDELETDDEESVVGSVDWDSDDHVESVMRARHVTRVEAV